jgi:Amt family ammonium transporter
MQRLVTPDTWFSSYLFRPQSRHWFRKVDDCLGVFHTHAVSGILGGFLRGIFASDKGCAVFGLTTPGGGIAGNGRQIGL